jgi:uncharacterized membrane protein
MTISRLAVALADRYTSHDGRHDRKVALKVLRPELAALALSIVAACQVRDSPRLPDTSDAPETALAGALRAIGTEPFWGLDIDSTGLRFTTPEDTKGIRWPPLTPTISGDTARWAGETERAAVDARIWPARCSDGMSDRVWPYTAVVRIDSTTYRGCAASRDGVFFEPHRE